MNSMIWLWLPLGIAVGASIVGGGAIWIANHPEYWWPHK